MTTKEIGKFELEYDGSIVICNQVVGKIGPDTMTEDEINELNAEIVRRWNHFEKKSGFAFGASGKKIKVSIPQD